MGIYAILNFIVCAVPKKLTQCLYRPDILYCSPVAVPKH